MRRTVLALVLVGGCASDATEAAGGDIDVYDDDDLPAGTCRDTGTDTDPCDTEGTTVGAAPGAGDNQPENTCVASSDCMGGVCAAEFDPETTQHGPLQCQFACIPLLDDTKWCSDDASCCQQGAVCTGRGYCVVIDDAADTE